MEEPALDNLTFEQAMAELERIVRDLEDGQSSLEQSLARYELGVTLLKRSFGQLRDAEQRILQLTGQNDEGEAILRPFEHAAATEKATNDLRRRKSASES